MSAVPPACRLCGSSRVAPSWTKKGFDLFRCDDCDVLFVHPAPATEEIHDLYEGGDYHGWMAQWAESGFDEGPRFRGRLVGPRRKASKCLRLLQRCAPRAGSVLDVGCAAGFFLEVAQREGWRVEGAELNPATAAVTRERLGCPVHVGALENLDLESESFDAVTAWDLVEHLTDPRDLLRFARKTLRPGGLLGLSTPNFAGLYPQLSYPLAPKLGFWAHPDPPSHLFQFSLRSITNLLKEQGFDPERIRHGAIPPEYGLGGWRHSFATLRSAAYFLAFLGPILLGPLVGMGDLVFIVARKREDGDG